MAFLYRGLLVLLEDLLGKKRVSRLANRQSRSARNQGREIMAIKSDEITGNEKPVMPPKPTRTPERIELPGGYWMEFKPKNYEEGYAAHWNVFRPRDKRYVGELEEEGAQAFAAAMNSRPPSNPQKSDITSGLDPQKGFSTPALQSPVRSAEVKEALEWLDTKEVTPEYYVSKIFAYIAQIEASQPKPQQSDEGLRKSIHKNEVSTLRRANSEISSSIDRLEAALSQAPVPTSGAVEASVTIGDEALATAKRIEAAMPLNRDRHGFEQTGYDVLKAAAIIQQAMDGVEQGWRRIDENHKPGTSIVLVSHGSGTWPAIWDDYAKGYIEYGTPDKTVIAATHYMPLPRLNLSALCQPPAADGKLREALEDARAGEPEIVIKAGGLWPGATGMRTNGPPENVICIPCGSSQVRAKRALDALRAALAQPASGGGE